MNSDTCDKIVEFFEVVRARPVMYTGKSSDYTRMIQLITGFYLALEITNQKAPNPDDVTSAYLNRGWKAAYFGAVEEMKAKEMDGDEIVRELLSVEIDLWRDFCGRCN